MAKNKNFAEKSEDVITSVPENEAFESAEGEAPVIPQVEPEAAKKKPRVIKWVYVGPTVVRTELIAGRVFVCDGTTIEERLAGTFKKFPEARKLFVSPEKAADAINKIRGGGNSLAIAYKHLEKIRTGG